MSHKIESLVLASAEMATVGICELPYARSGEESEYQRHTSDRLDQFERDRIRISTGVDCHGFRPNSLGDVYFLDRWEN